MRILLFLVFILNVLDAAFTSIVVGNALATEINPLMRALLEYGIAPFVVIKLLIITISLSVLWKYRKNRLAKIGAVLCVLVYAILIGYVVSVSLYPSYYV